MRQQQAQIAAAAHARAAAAAADAAADARLGFNRAAPELRSAASSRTAACSSVHGGEVVCLHAGECGVRLGTALRSFSHFAVLCIRDDPYEVKRGA